MNDNIFLDTNVLVYCYTTTELDKQALAIQVAQNPNAWVSTQVIQELANILRKKFGKSWSEIQKTTIEVCANFRIFTNNTDAIKTAVELADRYGYSFYDSLILSSSLEIGCTMLFSEDMQNGQVIEDKLLIKNPFA